MQWSEWRWARSVMPRPPLHIWPTGHRGGDQGLRILCRGREGRRRTRTRPEPWPTREFSLIHEVDGAADYGVRQNRTSAQGHSPQGGTTESNQETWYTTGVRSGHGDLRRERAERSNGSGYDRSSGELVATLCAACLQDGAAGAGAHTRTEPVLAGLATIIWLKGALHGASCETSPKRDAVYECSCASGTRRTTHQSNAANRRPDTKHPPKMRPGRNQAQHLVLKF